MEDIMSMNWKCHDCSMTFTNPSLLQKHKARFCIGGWVGDPDHLMLRKSFRSEVPRETVDVATEVQETTIKYNPQSDPKVKQLAENHGRHMEALHNRNRDLERQREEIRRRLDELSRRPIKDDDSMNALLQELRDQEARNKRLLEELRRQLLDARRVPPHVIHHTTMAPGEPLKTNRSLVYPMFYGNSLVAEIAAVRQAYIANGGSDPDILQQLAQMQAEAQAIDDSLRNRPAPSKPKDNKHTDHLLTLELENERLQRQLLLLQEQNLTARNRRKDDREGRRGARVTAFEKVKELVRPRATTGPVPPLDVKYDDSMYGLKNQVYYDNWALHSTWSTVPDPLKAKIDKDVQNKYGYKQVSRRLNLERRWYKEDYRPDRAKTHLGIGSLIPDKAEEEVPIVPPATVVEEPGQTPSVVVPTIALPPPSVAERGKDKDKDKTKDFPYYKVHMASSKLNRVEQDLRNNYSRMSKPNVSGEDLELWDQREVLDSEAPIRPYNYKTKFEDEFFLDTARTETEGDAPANRTGHQSRPKLVVEDRK